MGRNGRRHPTATRRRRARRTEIGGVLWQPCSAPRPVDRPDVGCEVGGYQADTITLPAGDRLVIWPTATERGPALVGIDEYLHKGGATVTEELACLVGSEIQ